MRRINLAVAALFLALSAVTVAGTWDLGYWADFAPGPAFAPLWIGAAGAILALLLIVQEMRAPSPEPADLPVRPAFLRVLSTVAALVAALALAPRLGFVPAAAILTLFVLVVVERRRIVPSVLVTVVTAALIHGVFVAWLNVALPKGALGL